MGSAIMMDNSIPKPGRDDDQRRPGDPDYSNAVRLPGESDYDDSTPDETEGDDDISDDSDSSDAEEQE